ncbi:lectin C-type domain protein [Cooperia oncophora]
MNGFENAMLAESAVAQNIRSPYFVGMNKLQGNWSNSDGSSYTYTNWSPGQPSASATCAVSNAPDGSWTSVSCSNPAPFICAIAEDAHPAVTCPTCATPTCPPPPRQPGHCESEWTYFEGTDSCYHIAQSGNDYGSGSDLTWIGLRQADYPSKTTWTWTDGTPVNYQNWAPKQPDDDHGSEHCGQAYSDYTGKDPTKDSSYRHWNDIPCSTSMRAFVCKKAALH